MIIIICLIWWKTILMDELIELLQIPTWLGAAIIAVYVSNNEITKERAWKLIATGLILGFLRVIWKFLPPYEISYDFQLIRYIIGIAASTLIFYGIFEYYTESTGLQLNTDSIKKPLITIATIMTATYLLSISFTLNEMTITHIRLMEETMWIIFSLLSLLMVINIHNTLSEEGLNSGIISLAIPMAFLVLYYFLSILVLVFDSPTLQTHTFHTLREGIEAISGVSIMGSFLYIYKKSLFEQGAA